MRNRIKCNRCGDIIESTRPNEYKKCRCGLVSVGGGQDYRVVICSNNRNYTDLSGTNEKENKA